MWEGTIINGEYTKTLTYADNVLPEKVEPIINFKYQMLTIPLKCVPKVVKYNDMGST